MKKINRLIIMIPIILVILLISFSTSDAKSNTKKDIYNILLINSFDIDNRWQNQIKLGLEKVIEENKNIRVKAEYLDIKNSDSSCYIENFENLLNSKYKNNEFDLIITINDEAFDLARKNLFNSKSIFYKKMVVFIGVSDEVNLTEKEKSYITGFEDGKSKIELIDLIISLNSNIKKINVLIDDTSYAKKLKNKLLTNTYLLDKDIKLNFIESRYVDEILSKLKNIDEKSEAVLICGVFKNENTLTYIKPEKLIQKIKSIKDIPIYTNEEDYIGMGTVGGYVDIGYEHGQVLGKMVLKIYEENSIDSVPLTSTPSSHYIVDYEQIYKYNIDIYNIPKESIIINKKLHELLLPKSHINMINIYFLGILIVIIWIIIRMLKHRKNEIKNKRLYKIAKEREELKTDFITNMSHEFRTPLNIITSASELLEITANKNEQVKKEYIIDKAQRIHENANRLIRLVNNLIDITKFDFGFHELNCKNENIVYVVEDIVFATLDYASKKNIELVFDTDEEEIITFIDKEKIERVVLNLLSNAIKYTHENGKIEVDIKHDKKFVYITIKDNGIGIPIEKVNHIFQRFYQVDSILSRQSEGSGIGLYLVDEIMKMHNGKVKITTEENKGTAFELTLNISQDYEYKDDFMEEKNNRSIEDVVKLEMSNI